MTGEKNGLNLVVVGLYLMPYKAIWKKNVKLLKDTESHPATYSPTMVSEFIRFLQKEGQNVLDPFAGIGSALVGCKRTGRIGYGIELNPRIMK